MLTAPSYRESDEAATDSAPIKMLDLFAGCGGLSRGFHQASPRYQVVKAVEMDLMAAASFAATFGTGIVYHGRIEDWLREETAPGVDVVVGGPPCQGFSQLGKQDKGDGRNGLWRQYVEAVKKASPRYFVLENVPAFLSSAEFEMFRCMTERGQPLAGYDFMPYLLNAADYGAPQLRKRVIVIGWLREAGDPGAPCPTHEGSWVTVRSALRPAVKHVVETALPAKTFRFGGLDLAGPFTGPELHVTRNYAEISLRRFAAIPEGGSRFDLTDDLKAPCWRTHTSGSGDVMGRLRWDRPSVTIRTEFTKPEKGRYIHPSEPRAITPYEGALLQGFPREHRWVGSKTSIVKQIGNAVPVPLGAAIARHLLSLF
jgi:DNA (cytosine-5)-methyltransferase 1